MATEIGDSEKGISHDSEKQMHSGDDFQIVTDSSIDGHHEVLEVLDLDPALNKKMHIVNNVGLDQQSC